MKTILKTSFVLLFCSASLFGEQLPPDWHVLPEDRSAYVAPTGLKKAMSLERLLEVHRDMLDDLELKKVNTGTRWEVDNIELGLALSAQGSLGVLVTKGTTAAQILWRPAKARSVSDEDESVPAQLSFREGTTEQEAFEQLEPLVQSIVASGRVHNEGAMRTNLRERVSQFIEVTKGLSLNPGYGWWLSKLRLDIVLDASGSVAPGISAGGAVRLRFEWIPCEGAQVNKPEQVSEKNRELRQMVKVIASQMQRVSVSEFGGHYFPLNSTRWGITLSAKGTIGVAKASGAVTGYLFFKPYPVVSTVFLEEPPYLPIVGDPVERHLQYASDQGIRYEPTAITDSRKGVVYYLPKERFYQGIKKGAALSKKLMKRLANAQSRNWELFKTQANFSLSLSGNLGLASVGGAGSVRLVYKN